MSYADCEKIKICTKCVGVGCEYLINWQKGLESCVPPGANTTGWDIYVDPYAIDLCPLKPTPQPENSGVGNLIWLWILLGIIFLIPVIAITKWRHMLQNWILHRFSRGYQSQFDYNGEIEMASF